MTTRREATLISETREFTIGSEVTCNDGVCGELKRVVIDPVARALTHLVVEPKHRRQTGHLVPIDLVDSTTKEIRLRCSMAEFEALEDAEETHFLPGASRHWGYEQGQMLSWPYYALRMGGGMGMCALGIGGGMGTGGLGMGGMGAGSRAIISDRVPVGEVEVRRSEHVHAKDGTIGRVQGLVIDPSDHHVTHVLLDEGHLWGEKRVAIPIGAVTGVDDGVSVSLTKDEVRDLPPVDLDVHD
jgi:sporulation protein YlmC with PRC-barrel domain